MTRTGRTPLRDIGVNVRARANGVIGSCRPPRPPDSPITLLQRARRLFFRSDAWAATEAVANALLERGRLEGEEVERLVREARP